VGPNGGICMISAVRLEVIRNAVVVVIHFKAKAKLGCACSVDITPARTVYQRTKPVVDGRQIKCGYFHYGDLLPGELVTGTGVPPSII